MVRTVTVAFRPKNQKDVGKPYMTKDPQKLVIGVQRFAVLMATEEAEKLKAGGVLDDSRPPPSEMTEN